MAKNPTVVFENDGANEIFVGSTGKETVTLDRGNGSGMSSGEFLLMSLGSCVIGTLRNYLVNKEIKVDGLRVEVTCSLDEATSAFQNIKVTISSDTLFSDKLKATAINVAKTCRIHKTLDGGPDITVEIVD
jgi:uncharacterized OsmC-like protein